MELKGIINGLCDEADELLAGVSKPSEARAVFAEVVNIRHGKLPPGDKKAVIDQVMRILDTEGFFAGSAGDPGDEADDFSAAEEP